MIDHLTILIYASIGAMGTQFRGPYRWGGSRFTRSAVMGMAACCMGIPRTEEAALKALDRSLGVAMLMTHPGKHMSDFHTIQAANGPIKWMTRREELARARISGPKGDPHMLNLSHREYRTDLAGYVAFYLRPDSEYTLEDLSEAFKFPRFAPYVGRKCCSLGLPFNPSIIAAANPVEALMARRVRGTVSEDSKRTGKWPNADREELDFLDRLPGRLAKTYVAMDVNDAENTQGLTILRIENRSDQLVNRDRWQFETRREALVTVP